MRRPGPAAGPEVSASVLGQLSGQHPDGGWGADGRSDPLSTAFAALALAALAQPGTGRALRPAVDFLLAAQQPDCSWPGCPVIAFSRVGGPGVHTYRSSTITTSFCLKALLACRAAHATGRIARPRVNPATIACRPTPDLPTAADWSLPMACDGGCCSAACAGMVGVPAHPCRLAHGARWLEDARAWPAAPGGKPV